MILEPIDLFDNTFYCVYEYKGDDISPDLIGEIKSSLKLENTKEYKKFVYDAVLNLNRTIELPDLNTIVFPQTKTNLNRNIIKLIGNLTYLRHFIDFKLLENLPKHISFDFLKFEHDELGKINSDGKPVYTEHAKKQILKNINDMLDNIRKSEYFSIERSIKDISENFLVFESDKEKQKYLEISQNEKDILIIDDVTTTGTTLLEMLRILRSINNKNKITIFTLVGKKF